MMESTAALQAQGLSGLGHCTTHIHCRDSPLLSFLGKCPISLLPVDADGGKLLSNILVNG